MSDVGIGHNSRISELEAANAALVEKTQVQARVIAAQEQTITTLTKENARLAFREAQGGHILDSDLPQAHKLMSLRIIKSADDEGRSRPRLHLLAKAASVKSPSYVSQVVGELRDAGIVTSNVSGGPMDLSLVTLAELQTAVERYAQSKPNTRTSSPKEVRTSSPKEVRVKLPPQRKLTSSPEEVRTSSPEQVQASNFLPKGSSEGFEGGDKGGGESLRTPQSSEYAETSFMADAKKIAPTKNRGSRIPADWALNDRLRKWAREKFPLISEAQVADEAENFHSYWLSEGSAKASKIDWNLAFTVWATRAFRQLLRDQMRAAKYSGQPVPMATRQSIYWWQDAAKVASMTPERWRQGIAKLANGTWPVAELGPPPGHHECKIPRSIVAELRLEEIYTVHGTKRKTATEGSLL